MKLYKWYIRESPTNEYGWYVEREDGKVDEHVNGAHCKACAMTRIISENEDADCDLRGYRNTPCYQFLAVLVRQRRRECQKQPI